MLELVNDSTIVENILKVVVQFFVKSDGYFNHITPIPSNAISKSYADVFSFSKYSVIMSRA